MNKSKITASYEVKVDARAYGMDFGTVAQRVMRDARKSMPMETKRAKAVSACRRALVALRGVRGLDARCDGPIDALIVNVGQALRALGIKGGG